MSGIKETVNKSKKLKTDTGYSLDLAARMTLKRALIQEQQGYRHTAATRTLNFAAQLENLAHKYG